MTDQDAWVDRFAVGSINLEDLAKAESLEPTGLLASLEIEYPYRFLYRRSRDKVEVGLAKTRKTDTFGHCLLITWENGRLTTLARMSLIQACPARVESESIELKSGAGFNLYRDPDGWKLKLLEERTVSLSKETLHARGWAVAVGDGG